MVKDNYIAPFLLLPDFRKPHKIRLYIPKEQCSKVIYAVATLPVLVTDRTKLSSSKRKFFRYCEFDRLFYSVFIGVEYENEMSVCHHSFGGSFFNNFQCKINKYMHTYMCTLNKPC